MSVDVKFTPSPDLEKRLEQAAEAGILAATLAVEQQVVAICPVGKSRPGYVGGRLRGSITHKTFKDDGKIPMKTGVAKGEGIVGTNVYYAPYVEYGTYKMAPRAFLRRGLDAIKPKFAEIYGSAFKRVLG